MFWALSNICANILHSIRNNLSILWTCANVYVDFNSKKLTPITHSAHSYFLVLCTAHNISCRNLNQNPIISHHKIDNTFFFLFVFCHLFHSTLRTDKSVLLAPILICTKQPRWKSISMVIMFILNTCFESSRFDILERVIFFFEIASKPCTSTSFGSINGSKKIQLFQRNQPLCFVYRFCCYCYYLCCIVCKGTFYPQQPSAKFGCRF